ncbi:MAG: MATE family efflux transporter, partial [Halobacteriales archaeon]
LGFSYLVGVVLGYGLIGVYLGLAFTYVWWTVVVGWGFLRGDWAEQAEAMMAERDAAASDS